MEINKASIYDILEANFEYEIVDTILGNAIKMDAYSAFLFANVTGAGYLDNPVYPFSPKGVLKILREAFQYKVVTGIFDRNKLYYSPLKLNKIKPYLFEGDKYVVFKEFTSEIALSKEIKNDYETLIKNGKIPTDYIISRIEAGKKGNGMEPFLEYLACEYFKQKGYIVENQIPLVHAVGSPDFGGYKIHGKVEGFHIAELAMIRMRKNFDIAYNLDIEHSIVGEAKTSTTIMASQLEKYLKTTAFYKGYEIHPDKSDPTIDSFGLFNLDNKYRIQCREPVTTYTKTGDIIFNFDEYMDWYQNYLKMYLSANLKNNELEAYVNEKISRGKYTQEKIIKVIQTSTVAEMLEYIRNVI